MSRLIISIIIFIISSEAGYCGRAYIPINENSKINIISPAQKAIIAWNGKKEIIILSSDIYSADNTKLLSVAPFPALPGKVNKAKVYVFLQIQSLINKYGEISQNADFQKFEKLIYPLSIKAAETDSYREFVYWVKSFFLKYKAGFDQSSIRDVMSVIKSYLKDGSNNYVFEVYDINKNIMSTAPVLYVFDSSFLYYPLRIDNANTSKTDINLFLITLSKPNISETETGIYCKLFKNRKPVKIMIKKKDLLMISQDIYDLFKDNKQNNVWITYAGYSGEKRAFTRDFKIYQ